jgi:hypothetical protein
LAKGLTQAMSPTKRWLRISLRTSFVLFTCVAIAVGWFARYANQRWAAFAALRQAGADIQMGVGEPSRLEDWFGAELFGTVNKVDLREGKADNKLMVRIAALQELRRLDLSNADIDDDGLRLIKHLPLRELWLQETKISDASAQTLSQIKSLDFLQLNATSLSDAFLEQLQPLPELENLGLRGTDVTGDGMKYLSRHPKLKKLDVYHTEVDDSGVAYFVACQSLGEIGLSMTKVTDAVFEHLDKLPKLTDVDLNASPVTTQAVLAFEMSHPKCDIEWYRPGGQ